MSCVFITVDQTDNTERFIIHTIITINTECLHMNPHAHNSVKRHESASSPSGHAQTNTHTECFSRVKGSLMFAQCVWSLRPAVQYFSVCVCYSGCGSVKNCGGLELPARKRPRNKPSKWCLHVFCWRTQGQGLNQTPAGFMRCMLSTGFTARALFVVLLALKLIADHSVKFPWKYTLGTSEQCQEFIFWNRVFWKRPLRYKKSCRNMMKISLCVFSGAMLKGLHIPATIRNGLLYFSKKEKLKESKKRVNAQLCHTYYSMIL